MKTARIIDLHPCGECRDWALTDRRGLCPDCAAADDRLMAELCGLIDARRAEDRQALEATGEAWAR